MATGAFAFGRTYVDPPAVRPTGHGLLFASDLREVPDGSPEMRGFSFDSDSGEATVGVVSFTGAINSTNNLTENADESNIYTSDDPFTVFGSYSGVMPVRSVEEANARAGARLKLGEGIGAEKGFWNGTLAKHANGHVLNTTAVSAKLGLGLLLEWMGKNYVGIPYLHTGLRAVNELAGGQLIDLPGEGVPTAKGGATLIPGAGYYDIPTVNTNADGTSGTNVTPSTNQAWVFASGAAVIYRDEILPTEAPKWDINQVRAYAQRTYTCGVDGPVAAVLITLT